MKSLKECRFVKMLFTKSGSGSISPRITLPSTWIREMGITREEREVSITFDGKKIIIEKR